MHELPTDNSVNTIDFDQLYKFLQALCSVQYIKCFICLWSNLHSVHCQLDTGHSVIELVS